MLNFFVQLIILLLTTSLVAQEPIPNESFLTNLQITKLYDEMINEIELLDAEGIQVRNRTKEITWEEYKMYHREKFIKSKSFSELQKNFQAFGNGFVSGHSDFDFLYPIESDTLAPIESNIKLGFTYPTFGFFDIKSKQTITKINEIPIETVFHQFVNYQTVSTPINDCQRSFKKRFENGQLLVDGKMPSTVHFANGTSQSIAYKTSINYQTTYDRLTAGINLEGKYQGWKTIGKGYKVAVLQKDSIALVKIKNFLFLKGRGGGFDCQEEAADSTHCAEVQVIRTALDKIAGSVNYLIIDLQENIGGHENIRFAKELCPNEFYDLRVQYKKTSLLEDDELRPKLFYYSKRAENWYQDLKTKEVFDTIKTGDFLPIRAGFCRGDSLCQFKPIPINSTASRVFKQIIVLVNENTVSSGDDFTFKFEEYADALIAGQPQASDLTYSLVSILFYLDPAGKISKKYFGNRQREFEVDGTELFKFSIPYSKTIDKHGAMLQGNPLPLDLEVALTKENFLNREEHVLDSAIKNLIEKK